jgi:hypothetical protein
MNLLKIQDALKNASDDQLMQLMQAPDSSAPSYLVLSEIRRRKDMRAQQPQEPQGTVAEDLASTPQTYDQAGIRSLRTPGYEEEERASPDDMQEMREGGVVRMQAGGLPPRLEDFYTGRPFSELNESELRALAGPQAAMSVPQPGRLRFPGLAPNPLMASIPEDQRNILSSEARMELARRQPASRNYSAMGPEPEMTETEMTLQPALPPRPSDPAPFGEQNRGLAGAIPPDPTNPNYNQPSNTTPPASTQQGGAAGGGGAAAGIRGAGAGGGSFEDGVLGGMRRLEAAFPNNLAALRAELEKGRTNPQERRREAQNLALVEAGLRMAASRNPSFLGSIGEGATPAVQSYAQQLGQIRQDERQDIRDRFSLEQANLQRMYALGQISAAEYRTRVAEAGANARLAASEAGANERLRLGNDRLAQQDLNSRRTAASASLRSNTELRDLGTQAAELQRFVRNAREGSAERSRFEAQLTQVRDRIRNIEREKYSELGLQMQGSGPPVDYNYVPGTGAVRVQ